MEKEEKRAAEWKKTLETTANLEKNLAIRERDLVIKKKELRDTLIGSSKLLSDVFDSIKIGMTYTDVILTIGKPSKLSAESGTGAAHTKVYLWGNIYGEVILSVTFQDDKVYSKNKH